jgi:hypothetical protein
MQNYGFNPEQKGFPKNLFLLISVLAKRSFLYFLFFGVPAIQIQLFPQVVGAVGLYAVRGTLLPSLRRQSPKQIQFKSIDFQ